MSFTIHDKLALVVVAEDAAWEEILRGCDLARHVVKMLSPRAIVIEPQAVDPLVSWLRRHGYLPKVIE
jgi:hypothetical protein